MSSSIMFQLLLTIAVAMVNISEAKMFNDCEYQELTKCDKIFMDSYQTQDGKKPSKEELTQMYCDAFQNYVNCLSANPSCKGAFVDLDRLMILQHATMDKKLQRCPNHDTQQLRDLVKADLQVDLSSIDVDAYEDCAEQIHHKCASNMADDFNKDNRMCYGVRNFVSCYSNPGITCSAAIYKDFNDTLQRLAKLLLKIFEESPGTMPNC